ECLLTVELQELGLRLESPVAPDVGHLDAVPHSHPRDQEPAMAVRRILLAAHHRDHACPSLLLEYGDAGRERCRGSDLPVEDVSVGIEESVAVRPTPKLLAQEQIFDPGCAERGFESLSIELRRVPRPRVRADIGEHLYPVHYEEREEV